MAKSEGNGFYSGKLLTLNANSSDDYVKSIYDEWAETYDKVSSVIDLLQVARLIRRKFRPLDKDTEGARAS